MQIFTTEEEVQVWMDGHDRIEGRVALARMIDQGGMPEQSMALAREWLARHPYRQDRRGRGRSLHERVVAWRGRMAAGRRHTDGVARNPFFRPLVGVAMLVLVLLAAAPGFRDQDVISPIDGGFNSPGMMSAGPYRGVGSP